jgi:RHS repeat-associated protein
MILTEEIHSAGNTATMETSRSVLEESIFGQTGVSNEVASTRFDKPPGWTGNSSAKVSRTGTGHNIGPNTLQKVMAGDMINATAQYYHQGTAGGNSSTMVNSVLASLVQAITGSGGAGALVKGNTGSISTQLSGAGGFINAVQPNGSSPTSTIPQAFLTAIFFDERFNMIPAADGGVVQLQVAASVGGNGGVSVLNPTNYKAPKNGYVYIYLSNQSNNDVYWDNFQVGITQGNIAEENHYYAYGLKIATLSSKKLGDVYQGSLKNNYLYQGAYAELDEDIGWTDFALRNYDAQIGRWVQQDPYQEFASPYSGMANDPVNFTDPSGGSILSGLSTAGRLTVTTLGGAIIGQAIYMIGGGEDWKGALIGAGAGLGVGLGALSNKIAVSMSLHTVAAALNILNSQITTSQAGKQALTNQLKTISIVIHHGSTVHDKHAGGKSGGHVTINFGDDELYGFTGWSVKPELDNNGDVQDKKIPLFPTKNPNNINAWYSEIHGSEGSHNSMTTVLRGEDELGDDDTQQTYQGAGLYTIFEINVSQEKFDQIHNWYTSNLGKAPYPYTLFGMRCTSSVFHELTTFNIIPKGRLFLSSFFNAHNPGALFKYLWGSGYSHNTIVQPNGIKKEDLKKYNFYGKRSLKKQARN